MTIRPLSRAALIVTTVVALSASTVSNRAYAAEAVPAQETQGWCFWACGLGLLGCCIFAPELCDICGLGADPCIDYCEAHYGG